MNVKQRSPITTHVLDTANGKAASGVAVTLEYRESESRWVLLGQGTTNSDGRAEDLLPAGSPSKTGIYRLTFNTEKHSPFFPSVVVIFQILEVGSHYHVPLLLSPYGYCTYRGT